MSLSSAGDRPRAEVADVEPVCSIQGLSVTFATKTSRPVKAVDDMWLDIMPGEAVGVVGESGSGKSVMGLAMLGLVPPPGTCSGRVMVGRQNVLTMSGRDLTRVRGRKIGLILQDPTPSLNPIRKIGSQLREAAGLAGIPKKDRQRHTLSGLDEVGLDPNVLGKYPFELSGGMNQRIAIAMALLQEPELLIADEPTTALDVTTQANIIALLDGLRRRRGMALLLVSHDMGVVYQIATRVCVMYAGRLVEAGDTESVVRRPAHPYTRWLISLVPSINDTSREPAAIPGQFTPARLGDRGCPFAARCSHVEPVCLVTFPGATRHTSTHTSWCWWAEKADDRAPMNNPEAARP